MHLASKSSITCSLGSRISGNPPTEPFQPSAEARHHLSVALDSGTTVVAFAIAVHYSHPDKKRPEMWINEVGLAPPYRGRGVAKQLLNALFKSARDAGCKEAWVLTERSNTPARVGGNAHFRVMF